MIVKRVAEAMRRQDWAAVTIEFLLVVLGILIAFQITEWAAEREASTERDTATERLLGEAEATVAFMRQGVTGQQEVVDDLHFALGRIERGQWQPADEDRMTKGLYRSRSVASPVPPSSVYDDLVSSGAFGKIGDAHLRATIADYRATLSFTTWHTDSVRDKLPDLENAEALLYSFSPDGPPHLRLDVDYAALRNDRLLREKLAIIANSQRQMLVMRQRLLKDSARMCVELGRFVGRRCDLNLPPPTFD